MIKFLKIYDVIQNQIITYLVSFGVSSKFYIKILGYIESSENLNPFVNEKRNHSLIFDDS